MSRLTRCFVLAMPVLFHGFVISVVPAYRSTIAAAEPTQAMPLDPARAALMKAHYSRVLVVHDALIRGDLASMAPAATAVAQQPAPPGLPPAVVAYASTMRESAGRAAGATTVAAAAKEAAWMLAVCGDCHSAAGTRPALEVPPPSTTPGVVGHMHAHQRAVDLMLQGLVIPSATLWQQGAQALKAAPLRRVELPRDSKLTREIASAETRVHQLADDALSAEDPGARANSYAQILTTCADCHSLHRTVWGPPAR